MDPFESHSLRAAQHKSTKANLPFRGRKVEAERENKGKHFLQYLFTLKLLQWPMANKITVTPSSGKNNKDH